MLPKLDANNEKDPITPKITHSKKKGKPSRKLTIRNLVDLFKEGIQSSSSGILSKEQCESFVPRTKAIYGRYPEQVMSESVKRHEENSNLIKEIRASTDAAICNQGASIKTLEIQIGKMSKELALPLLTYLNLGLSELAHTKLTIKLADKTVKYPKGIAENVLVSIVVLDLSKVANPLYTLRDKDLLKSKDPQVVSEPVILNGDSPTPTRVVEGVVQAVAPTTAEQRLAKKNELKARRTLLMDLPDKNQLKFNIHKDAKSLMEAIKKRFGENKKTKKVQKTLLKQQYENFTGSSSESLNQIHDRRQSLDGMFNNLKIYEAEVKSSSSISYNTQNIAFVSSQTTDSTNESVSAITSVSTASTKPPASTLPNEIDLKWQMAMLTMRARRFLQRTGRNLGANRTTSIGFDMSKADEEPTNYALMVLTSSSSSSSDNETDDSVPTSPVHDRPRPVLHGVNKAHSLIRRPINHRPAPKHSNFHKTITTVKVNQVNVVKGTKGNMVWKPKRTVLDHVSRITSASMTLKQFNYTDALGRSKFVEVKGPTMITKDITLRFKKERIIFTSDKPASSLIKRVYMLSLRDRMEIELEARLMGETLVLNRSLDPLFEDYIELNDLNEPFKLRRNQGDDLIPTIEEGEVIEEFRTSSIMKDKMEYKGNNIVGTLMNIPIFVGTFSILTNFAVLENMNASRDEGMGDVIGEPF
nr:hypothetical protein [Tanacetum cinerariifolium]